MEIRFTIENDELARGIEAAVLAAQDFGPAMAEIAGLMEFETRERFETGRGPDDAPWQPSQRVLEQGGKTLVDTAALVSSITADSDSSSAVVGTNLIYAAIHQQGGTIRPRNSRALRTPFGPRGSVNMPARPFLGFGQREQDEIPQILADHLERAFRAGAA
jgi:phage virion morphogenesis protein